MINALMVSGVINVSAGPGAQIFPAAAANPVDVRSAFWRPRGLAESNPSYRFPEQYALGILRFDSPWRLLTEPPFFMRSVTSLNGTRQAVNHIAEMCAVCSGSGRVTSTRLISCP